MGPITRAVTPPVRGGDGPPESEDAGAGWIGRRGTRTTTGPQRKNPTPHGRAAPRYGGHLRWNRGDDAADRTVGWPGLLVSCARWCAETERVSGFRPGDLWPAGPQVYLGRRTPP